VVPSGRRDAAATGWSGETPLLRVWAAYTLERRDVAAASSGSGETPLLRVWAAYTLERRDVAATGLGGDIPLLQA